MCWTGSRWVNAWRSHATASRWPSSNLFGPNRSAGELNWGSCVWQPASSAGLRVGGVGLRRVGRGSERPVRRRPLVSGGDLSRHVRRDVAGPTGSAQWRPLALVRQSPEYSGALLRTDRVRPMRPTRRAAPDSPARAADVLRGIGVVTVSPAVITRAVAYPDPSLRSLDAIHLATAESSLAGAAGRRSS